mgnify:FL=1
MTHPDAVEPNGRRRPANSVVCHCDTSKNGGILPGGRAALGSLYYREQGSPGQVRIL